MDYLDIHIELRYNCIYYRVHQKPLNMYQYPLYTSNLTPSGIFFFTMAAATPHGALKNNNNHLNYYYNNNNNNYNNNNNINNNNIYNTIITLFNISTKNLNTLLTVGQICYYIW